MSSRTYPETLLRETVSLFSVYGDFRSAQPYGSGHINDTFKVDMSLAGTKVSYILQRINDTIFKQPARVMENIVRVTRHIAVKHAGDPDASRKTLTVINARDGKPLARGPDGGWWRMYVFIEGARTVDLIERPVQAYKAANAFARFQNDLADLPQPRLYETIPEFHNTLSRLAQLDEAAAADVCARKAKVSAELAFVDAHRAEAGRLIERMRAGEIPERITHNDTKINNVMLDDATGEGCAVIDLDTVMPGLALYDFGDMVRTSTANAAEDERDLSKVYSRLDMFEQLARGYLADAKFLVPAEREELVFSGRLITFTIGVRFLTDYLAGDTYFRTSRPDHNLDRCRTQLKMVESMEANVAEMEKIAKDAANAS